MLFLESMGFKNRTVHGDGKSTSSQQSIEKNTTMMRMSVVEVFIVFIVRHLLHWTQCSIIDNTVYVGSLAVIRTSEQMDLSRCCAQYVHGQSYYVHV